MLKILQARKHSFKRSWNIWKKRIYNYDYFDPILFPRQCGFQKRFSAQYRLLVMTGKFKEAIDKGISLLLPWLTFPKYLEKQWVDCISHLLLIAKIYRHGVLPMSATWFLPIGAIVHNKSKLMEVLLKDLIYTWCVKGSVLGQLLFFMNVKKVILLVSWWHYPYYCRGDTQTIVPGLKVISSKRFHKFEYNHLKANPRKYHLLSVRKLLLMYL